MFIEKIEQNLIKITFYTDEEEIYLGDLIKVVYPEVKGVLAQVVKLESASEAETDSPEESASHNTATAKILFTIDESGKLSDWQGNVPAAGFVVSKLDPQEMLSVARTGDALNSVFSGRLSCYPETVVSIEASSLKKTSIVVSDKEEPKNDFLQLLSSNLSEKEIKTVLVDFNGEFSECENALRLQAGKDIKLPLDLKGLESLYDKVLSGVSMEVRAGIENIFTEIEDYLSSSNVSFIPFQVFLDAVNAECQANKTAELDLLSNSLAKLKKKGIFANEQKEITSLFKSFKENNFVILDLSNIEKEWKQLFVDSVIRLNSTKLKKKFFLLMDIEKCLTTDFIEQFFVKGIKSGISPVFALSHKSELMKTVLVETHNIFAFAAQDKSKLSLLKHFLPRIGASDILISGKITNNIPLYVKLPSSEEIENEIFISQEEVFQNIQEIEPSYEEEPASEFDQEYSEEEDSSELYEEEEEISQQQVSELEEDEDFEEELPEQYVSEFGQGYSSTDNEEDEDFDEDEEVSGQSVSEFEEEEDTSELYEDEEDDDFEEEEETSGPPASEFEQEYSSADYEEDEDFEEDDEELADLAKLGTEQKQAKQESYDENDDFDYSSSEEFQDESVLDYVSEDEYEEDSGPAHKKQQYREESSSLEFSDDDLKNFMDYDEEETSDYSYNQETNEDEEYEEEEEEYSSKYQAPAQQPEQDFSDDDLKSFMDYDDEEEYEEVPEPPVKKVKKKQRKSPMPGPSAPNLPVYNIPGEESGSTSEIDLQEGDTVRHKKYGIGVIKKVIGYSEKKLCSIQFEDVGRRLLDPKIAELEKV